MKVRAPKPASTPRQLLAQHLRQQFDQRQTLVVDGPDGLTNLEAGRHALVLSVATIEPAPNRQGARSYAIAAWLVSPNQNLLAALDALDERVEQLLQLLDRAPFEVTWERAEYDQFGEALFHAYRVDMRCPFAITYPDDPTPTP